jgi:hypothetical protein
MGARTGSGLAAGVRTVLMLVLPLLLLGCILAPGKFSSTLRIDADRRFAFSYQGEVHALDPGKGVEESGTATDGRRREAERDARNRALAEALSKEAGYRSVVYLGDGTFRVDYRIEGTLDYHFVFPFNADAQAIFPFVMVELRGNGTVRVKAPGFAADRDMAAALPQGGMGSDAAARLDGRFTLDTDAEIVSQNNEDGPVRADGRARITWTATPLTRDAPTAVLRLR